MDVYQMYIQYVNGGLPSIADLAGIYQSENVRLLECAALMYATRNQQIPMDDVLSTIPRRSQTLDHKMLTPLVVKHSCITPTTTTASMSLTPPSKPKQCAAISTIKFKSNTTSQNWRALTNDLFLYKSRPRIDSLATLLNVRVPLDWVRRVASKVDSDQPFVKTNYDLLTNSDRHIHVINPSVCKFLECLQNPTIKTFSWSNQSTKAIHLGKLRAALREKSNRSPYQWLIVACCIGLPMFEMYTPKTFIKAWGRFKTVTNDTCLKAVLRPLVDANGGKTSKSQSQHLLNSYRQHQWNIQDDIDWTIRKGVVDLFVFKYWYSYAEEDIVTHIADYANAIMNRCQPI